MVVVSPRNSDSVRIISFNISIMNEQEEKVAEDVMLEDTSPEGIMKNAELAKQVAEEVYQSDDDSDNEAPDMGNNYPPDMDFNLLN